LAEQLAERKDSAAHPTEHASQTLSDVAVGGAASNWNERSHTSTGVHSRSAVAEQLAVANVPIGHVVVQAVHCRSPSKEQGCDSNSVDPHCARQVEQTRSEIPEHAVDANVAGLPHVVEHAEHWRSETLVAGTDSNSSDRQTVRLVHSRSDDAVQAAEANAYRGQSVEQASHSRSKSPSHGRCSKKLGRQSSEHRIHWALVVVVHAGDANKPSPQTVQLVHCRSAVVAHWLEINSPASQFPEQSVHTVSPLTVQACDSNWGLELVFLLSQIGRHWVQTRFVVGVHACASNSPGLHGATQAAHCVSLVVVQAATAYNSFLHTVQLLQTRSAATLHTADSNAAVGQVPVQGEHTRFADALHAVDSNSPVGHMPESHTAHSRSARGVHAVVSNLRHHSRL
jgi:hypothetical protein